MDSDRSFDLPGFDPNQEPRLRALTFSGEHDCGTPLSVILTIRGNPGQRLRGLKIIPEILPGNPCEGCGQDIKSKELALDPQYGENPMM